MERLLSLAWSGIENSSRQLLSLVFFFVSVRFLQPSDLGVFALATALNAIPMIFIDEAIGESLVQKANITTADWDTGFTINLMLAVVFMMLSFAASWPLARLLGSPALLAAVPTLACCSLIGALHSIQKAHLIRALQFRLIAQTTMIAQLVGGIFAVALAASGFGYWALIANVFIYVLIATIIYWRRSPWKPRLRIDHSTVESRLPYAIYSMAIRSIYLLRDQSPLIIAGILVDITHVGFLSLALRVTRCLGQPFEEMTTRPLLSLLSREQHDLASFGRVLAEMLTIIGVLALPSYAGFALVGPRLLPLMFGAAWMPAAAFVPWLCIVLGSWLVLHIVAVALRARALGRIAVILTTPATVLDVVVLAALMPFGIERALAGWAARNLLSIPMAIWALQTQLGVPARELGRRWAPSLAASLLMAGLLTYLDRRDGFGHSIRGLAAMIGVGGSLYLLVACMLAITATGKKVMKRRFTRIIEGTNVRRSRSQ